MRVFVLRVNSVHLIILVAAVCLTLVTIAPLRVRVSASLSTCN